MSDTTHAGARRSAPPRCSARPGGSRQLTLRLAMLLALSLGCAAPPAWAAEASGENREPASAAKSTTSKADPVPGAGEKAPPPAKKRKRRGSSTMPQPRQELVVPPPAIARPPRIEPAPLPPTRSVPGDRGAPLGPPDHHIGIFPARPASPGLGTLPQPTPLPPTRPVPGESGPPLGPTPMSPIR